MNRPAGKDSDDDEQLYVGNVIKFILRMMLNVVSQHPSILLKARLYFVLNFVDLLQACKRW
jgi:hypothetical protein